MYTRWKQAVIKFWVTSSLDLHTGFQQNTDPRSTDPLLIPYKINGKMKIKKAQNYQWDPIQVHQ